MRSRFAALLEQARDRARLSAATVFRLQLLAGVARLHDTPKRVVADRAVLHRFVELLQVVEVALVLRLIEIAGGR